MPPLPQSYMSESISQGPAFEDVDSSFESSFQIMPPSIYNPLTLKSYAQRHLCSHVNFFNAIQMLVFAERTFSSELATFTAEFIQMNLDAILIHARSKDLAYLLDDFLASWEKLASFKKISTKSFEKYHAKYSRSRLSISPEEGLKTRCDSFDESYHHERTKSADLETHASALKVLKSIRKKLNSIKDIETAALKGAVLIPDQIEKLKRKAPLEAELRRLEPILKRLEAEESVRNAAQLRRPGATATATKNCALDSKEMIQGEPASILDGDNSSPSPSVELSTRSVVKQRKTFDANHGPSVTPSFSDWSSVSVTSNTFVSPSNHRKTAWKAITSKEPPYMVDSASYADSPPSVQKSNKSLFNSPSPSLAVSSPNEAGTFTLAEFLTPPVNKVVGKHENPITNPIVPRSWSKSAVVKSPISLSQIQDEEETIRLNSSTGALKGNDNPWFIERILRPDSFGDIVESQRQQSNREKMERKALIAAEELANVEKVKKRRSRKQPPKSLSTEEERHRRR